MNDVKVDIKPEEMYDNQECEQTAEDRYDELKWEKLARLFLVNTAAQLNDFVALLDKILTNIIQAPTEPKYRTIKASNNTIQRKILDRSGGVECLNTLGFTTKTDPESKNLTGKMFTLELKEDQEELNSCIASLKNGKDWLKENVAACIEISNGKQKSSSHTSSPAPAGDICAECIVHIKLPTGSTVCGGFLKTDKLANVRSFASSYFTREKFDSINLVFPHIAAKTITEEELSKTLEELKMCPRSKLIASSYSSAVAETVFHSAHTQAVEDNSARLLRAAQEKEKKKKEAQEREEDKKRIILAFKDDRKGRF